ncbi:predicted protein [Nematostella vectensis]|uniref:Uncharacterized protein n=1 Tax=Nematostella vectensis TaxID=45351 RepID=A7SYI6_NEMVE|nr:predicted protein [Nematostella vectensis]|eukprot:XP_001623325.1 predicted protein [Nematostella vectensis]
MSHKLLLLFLLGFVALALSAPIVEEELSPAAQDETKDEPQLEDQANQLEQVDDSEPEETEEAESEEVSEYETGSDEDANETRVILRKGGAMRPVFGDAYKGKHCDGPGGVPEIRGNSTTRNDELLNSLAAAVQTLTAEVQSLKADNASSRQSHSLPPSDVASSSRSSKDVSPRRATTVTLPELRAMDDLADAADRRVAHVLPIASSESDEEADMGALASSPLRKPNKAEFVAGYAQILQLREISSFERAERHKHLVTLMYHAQLYEWETVLAFHGAVLLEIERGLLKWGDSFSHLESRTLHGQLLSPPKKQSYSSGPTLFCNILFCEPSLDNSVDQRYGNQWQQVV